MDNPKHVTRVEHEGREILLVGTAHISARSVTEVEQVIERERPDSVCVELDQARYESLLDEDRWAKLDVFEVIRKKRVVYLLVNIALAAYQRRLGARLGVRPGAEFAAAIRKAREVGAQLVLADRDVQTTLKRAWHGMSCWTKARVAASLLALPFAVEELTEETLEQLKDRDTISEMLEAFAKEVPGVKEPLIDERDRYLISTVTDAPGKKIVAVVGAGHIAGMLANLGRPVDREALSIVPRASRLNRWFAWIVPMLILAACYLAYHANAADGVKDVLIAWTLPNLVVVGLSLVLAGAKPLTIALATAASPMAGLNPTLNVGQIAALLEARLRRPTVIECRRVTDDILHRKGVYANGLLRVLLVAIATNLSATLGAWLGVVWAALSLY